MQVYKQRNKKANLVEMSNSKIYIIITKNFFDTHTQKPGNVRYIVKVPIFEQCKNIIQATIEDKIQLRMASGHPKK